MSRELVFRKAEPTVREILRSFRVGVLNGPRQCGKTTLAKALADDLGGTFWSLDDPSVLSVAKSDPLSLLDAKRPVVIDEIQRAGDPLLLSIKQAVDQVNDRGQFLLTGSSNFLTVPTLSETLAGRVGIARIWPFAQSELRNAGEATFVDKMFQESSVLRNMKPLATSRAEYVAIASTGGYPEVQNVNEAMRRLWFDSYVQTLTQREIKDVSDVRRMDEFLQLLELIGALSAQEFNASKAADAVHISRDTARNYRALLEMVFLSTHLPAWSRNLSKRVIRREKIFISDSGLSASLVGASSDALNNPTSQYVGPLMETFVVSEIRKLCTWSKEPCRLFHYRDRSGSEVDLVLETRRGDVSAIEVKAAQSVSSSDFKGLEAMRDGLGSSFVNGAVLYTGSHLLSFGDRMTAVPISALWA